MSQKRGFFPDVSLPKPIFSEKPRFLASVLWYKTCCHSQIFTGGFCTKLTYDINSGCIGRIKPQSTQRTQRKRTERWIIPMLTGLISEAKFFPSTGL